MCALWLGGGGAVLVERVGHSKEGELPSFGKTQHASTLGNHRMRPWEGWGRPLGETRAPQHTSLKNDPLIALIIFEHTYVGF